MMGNKNLRILKILLPIAAVVLLLYLLYEYKQAANEASLQKRHLLESEEEYRALTKRFDMLSRELKNAVQSTADLDKQLKLEKKNRLKLESEKNELERQYETEGIRRSSENNKLSKDKLQLVEEKDELKRERDRLSSRVHTLTQEMAEQGDTHAANERKLHDDCNAKLTKETDKAELLNGDLVSCQANLRDSRSSLRQCREEHQLSYQRNVDSERYGRQGDDYAHNKASYRKNQDYHNPRYSQMDRQGRYGEGINRQYLEKDRQQAGDAHGTSERDGAAGHNLKDKHGHMDEKKKKEIYSTLHKKVLNGDKLTEKQRHAYRLLHTAYGSHASESHQDGRESSRDAGDNLGGGAGAGGQRARRRAGAGGGVSDAKENVRTQPSVDHKKAGGDGDPRAARKDIRLPEDDGHNQEDGRNREAVAQVPPAPVNNNNDGDGDNDNNNHKDVNENNNNNGDNIDHEEIKDLVDEKADGAKDAQKHPGVGENKMEQPGDAMEDSQRDDMELDDHDHQEVAGNDHHEAGNDHREAGDNNRGMDGDPDEPLQKPAAERDDKRLPKEGQEPVDLPDPEGGNEDDEDAAGADYNKHEREGGEDDRNRVKDPPVKDHDDVEDPDGRQAFLHDQKQFEQEQLRSLRREPRHGIEKEKQEQFKAMEKEIRDLNLPNKRRRKEIR